MQRLKMDDKKEEISKPDSSSCCCGHLPLSLWVQEKAEKKTQVSAQPLEEPRNQWMDLDET